MGGVADEHDAAVVPAVEVDPFDGPEMELRIVAEGGEIFGNRPAEALEMAADRSSRPATGSSNRSASSPAKP